MYWNKIKYFVYEALLFVAILTFFIYVLWAQKLIIIHWNILTIELFILISLFLITYVFNYLVRDVLVLLDFIFKKYDSISAVYVTQFSFKTSSLLVKSGKTRLKDTEKLFSKVVLECDGRIVLYTSQDFIPDLIEGKKYKFIVGRYSMVILDVLY